MDMNTASESKIFKAKGELWMKFGKNLTSKQILKKPDRHYHNLVVNICSELIASWAFTQGTGADLGPYIPGILVLAVGTGNWPDLQNPPPESAVQTSLYTEIARKAFSTVSYVNSGIEVGYRTNTVDFLTTFLATEANGALVEMGLFGGVGSLTPLTGGTMVNVKNFPVVNKPSGSNLSILWRLTF